MRVRIRSDSVLTRLAVNICAAESSTIVGIFGFMRRLVVCSIAVLFFYPRHRRCFVVMVRREIFYRCRQGRSWDFRNQSNYADGVAFAASTKSYPCFDVYPAHSPVWIEQPVLGGAVLRAVSLPRLHPKGGQRPPIIRMDMLQ